MAKGNRKRTPRFLNCGLNNPITINITPISSEVEWIPTTTVSLGEEQAQDVLKLVDKLEQDEDVQKVFHNLQ